MNPRSVVLAVAVALLLVWAYGTNTLNPTTVRSTQAPEPTSPPTPTPTPVAVPLPYPEGLPDMALTSQGAGQSIARVYADVNANMPRAYWDYDSVNISWGVLENYEVVRKIGAFWASFKRGTVLLMCA